MNKLISVLLFLVLVFTLVGCSAGDQSTSSDTTSGQTLETVATPIMVEYDPEDLPGTTPGEITATIQLEGSEVLVDGSGVSVDGSIVTITAAGTFSLRGILTDGQVIVDTADEEPVILVLTGVDITCSSSAPLYVRNAAKVVISLADGTVNRVTDGVDYIYADALVEEPDAAIFSYDDLTISGTGSLAVEANFNHGIVSQDDLKITGGTITVKAINDGIKGKNYIAIRDGSITITAGGDGMQSTNDTYASLGYISIEGGDLTITSALDGVQAETRLSISAGTLDVTSGGGSVALASAPAGDWGGRAGGMSAESSIGDTASTKGLKAGVDVTITGGSIRVDSLDDAVHSNASLTISAGALTLRTSDDGLHADDTLVISGGTLDIERSYEGIESACITLSGGEIHLTSSDDGINAAGGVDGSGFPGGPFMDTFTDAGAYHLQITGGYVYVDSGGDGLDINGSITMSGGTVIVNGPTNDGNGALDYLGSFTITGGLLVAVGSSGMAIGPDESSTQYSILYNFSSRVAAGTLLNLQSASGTTLLSFLPAKEYQSIVFSSPDLAGGMTCTIFTGGTPGGGQLDGLYSSPASTPGSEDATLTLSSIVTTAGSTGRGFGPGPRP